MKLQELKQLIREEIQNALNDDIIFTVDDDKLDQLLNDSYNILTFLHNNLLIQ